MLDRNVGGLQEFLGSLDPQPQHLLQGSGADLLLEAAGEAPHAGGCVRGDVLQCQRLMQVCVHPGQFIAGITIGTMVFGRLHDSNGGAGTESMQGYTIARQASGMGPTAVVLVKGPPVAAPGTRAAILALTARLDRLPNVTGTVNAYTSPAGRALRSADGHASVIVVSVRKNTPEKAQMNLVTALRAAARGAVPGATVQVGGHMAVTGDGNASAQNDLYRGEAVALPVLLIALFFIFRGWRAALLPLAAALATTAGALILLMGMTHVTDVATYSLDVIILFGLALAVDYSLLMVNRVREARAWWWSPSCQPATRGSPLTPPRSATCPRRARSASRKAWQAASAPST
jgi:RND superfamily putative drug exporter